MARGVAETLGLEDIADAAAWCAIRADRRTVARALGEVDVPGMVRPAYRGQPWRVPAAGLVTVLAAMLRRRAARECAPHGLRVQPFEHYEVEAARRLLATLWADVVPDELAEAVELQDEAARVRRRLEAEARREREAAAARAALERERERRRREREEEERQQRRHEAEERRRRLKSAYHTCHKFAYRDYAEHCARNGLPAPVGRHWPDQPEHAQYKADWPYDPPPGWEPPPGVLERVIPVWGTVPYGYDQEAVCRPLVPRYVPGDPCPWLRKAKGGR